MLGQKRLMEVSKAEEYIQWYNCSFRVSGFHICTFLFPQENSVFSKVSTSLVRPNEPDQPDPNLTWILTLRANPTQLNPILDPGKLGLDALD